MKVTWEAGPHGFKDETLASLAARLGQNEIQSALAYEPEDYAECEVKVQVITLSEYEDTDYSPDPKFYITLDAEEQAAFGGTAAVVFAIAPDSFSSGSWVAENGEVDL